MKNNIPGIIFVAVIAALLHSCVTDNSENKYTEQVYADFEIGASGDSSVTFNKDSVCVISGVCEYNYLLSLYGNGNAETGDLYGGFAFSRSKDVFVGEGHVAKPLAVFNADGGAEASDTFLVFHDNPDAAKMPSRHLQLMISSDVTCLWNGMGVHNTTAVVNAVLFGDNSFASGDYLKLTVTGYRDGTPTGSVDVMLADYTGASLKLIQDWTWVSLKDVGDANILDFALSSTKDIPRFFCLDDLAFTIENKHKN